MIAEIRAFRHDAGEPGIDGIAMAVTLNAYQARDLTEGEAREMLADIGVAGIAADKLIKAFAPKAAP